MRLKDKVALITGGAAGIGKATAQAFAFGGAIVVRCDMNEEAGLSVVPVLGPQAAFYKIKVTDCQVVQTWVDDVLAK